MIKFIDSLSTRELAVVIWITIYLIFGLFAKNIRRSIFEILSVLFAWKILVSLFIFFINTAFFVFILYKIAVWHISMLKDTIIWTLGFGLIALVNTNRATDSMYYKKVLIDTMKLTIVVEFIVNFFTFSLLKELILVPIIVLAAMMRAIASMDQKNKNVESFMKYLLSSISVFVFSISLYRTIQQYTDLFTFDNLKNLLLPIYLTITFLPFMYFFSLFIKYEDLWVRLKFIMPNKKHRNRIKYGILIAANLNIDKLTNISKNITNLDIGHHGLTTKMLRQISKSEFIVGDKNDRAEKK